MSDSFGQCIPGLAGWPVGDVDSFGAELESLQSARRAETVLLQTTPSLVR